MTNKNLMEKHQVKEIIFKTLRDLKKKKKITKNKHDKFIDKVNSMNIRGLKTFLDKLNYVKDEDKISANIDKAVKKRDDEKREQRLREIQIKDKTIRHVELLFNRNVTDKFESDIDGYIWLRSKLLNVMRGVKGMDYLMTLDILYYTGNEVVMKQNFDYLSSYSKKNFLENIKLKLMVEDYQFKPTVFVKENKKTNKVIFNINIFKPEITKILNIKPQVYRNNDNNICVYDACVKYFLALKDNYKQAKAIYNKLIKNNDLKKAYTDETLHEIGNFCNATIIIKDLVNGNDKVFKTDNARFTIELLNTKYNHLDLLAHNYNDVVEVDREQYNEIKKDASYYIEKYGTLTTLDKTYKIKDDDFKVVYKQWKSKVMYDNKFILETDEVMDMLNGYDYSMHVFFKDFVQDNSLYNELDVEKAYFNYVNYDNYIGVPSGSFININCDKFNMTHYNVLSKNKLVGFFKIEIMDIKDKQYQFEKLGFTIGSCHVLTSVQINLIKQYMTIKFINASYCPSCDMRFGNEFLDKIDGIKYYCKAYGLMFTSNNIIDMTIKPLECDKQYYSIVDNDDYNIYKHNDLLKIIQKNKDRKSYIHIAYFIHSYTKTSILEQLLKMNIDDVIGVKLDSIVVKKESVFTYDNKIFHDDFKVAKIEKMKIISCVEKSALDIDVEDDEGCFSFGTNFSYLFSKSDIDITYKHTDTPLYNGEIITNRVVMIGGKGGSGKTSSIMELENKYIVYSTFCWNLISGMKNKYKNINGLSLTNICGFLNNENTKTEKKYNKYCKFLVLDEMTLNGIEYIKSILRDKQYNNSFIFLLGDIDEDGKYFQCSIGDIYKGDKHIQYTKYTKSYRFDDELNYKLDLMREYMIQIYDDNNRNEMMAKYVKDNFKQCYKRKEDVIFNDNDVGISDINDYKFDNKLTEYFVSKGTKEQYYIKNTIWNKGQFKGQRITKPEHNNYECKLFKTIHSFQGLDLDHTNKIIISIKKNFDFNLYYTALSRARRLDQIVILN